MCGWASGSWVLIRCGWRDWFDADRYGVQDGGGGEFFYLVGEEVRG
jgi:hypothetical protein